MPGTLAVLKDFLGFVSFKLNLTGPVGGATVVVTLGGGFGVWSAAKGVAMRGAMTGSADFTIVDGAAEMVARGFAGAAFACVVASVVGCSLGAGGRGVGCVVAVVVAIEAVA
jgi:hypothetical protein